MCCQRLSPTAGDDGAQCTPTHPGQGSPGSESICLSSDLLQGVCSQCSAAERLPLGLSARFGATDLERQSRNSRKQPEQVHECGEECEEGDREERIRGDEAEQEELKKSGGDRKSVV